MHKAVMHLILLSKGLHGCKFGTKCIKADNHLSNDHQVAKGVYKVRYGVEKTMSPSEKISCVRLLNTESNGQSGCDSDESTTYLFSI